MAIVTDPFKMIDYHGTVWVRVPRRSYFGKLLKREYVQLVSVIDIVNDTDPFQLDTVVKRNLYLTDEEFILFKLGLTPNCYGSISKHGFTYTAGL